MVGGLVGNLLLPRLAETAGTATGFLAGAAAMLLIALLSSGLRPGTPAAARVAAGHG